LGIHWEENPSESGGQLLALDALLVIYGSKAKATELSGAETTREESAKALKYSDFYSGKIEVVPKVPIRSLEDLSIWYTPGVAALSRAIQRNKDLAFEYTNRWNTIAIITDGSRVLGLGDIGPEAALPVMEGKALIYKYLGGVDAIPLPLKIKNDKEFIEAVESLEPALGGVNLEDISSPRCFGLLETLRRQMSVPVWHDDQQGTAGVVLAALYNALRLTERKLNQTTITLLGSGAANVATARLLIKAGADAGSIILVDSKGILSADRNDIDQLMLRNRWKYDLALKTNKNHVWGGLDEALIGVDVLIAASRPGPGRIGKAMISSMNKRSIVFLLANPIPEMWPDDARAAGAEIIATGRSDFPNQVNNSLLFPAAFRGALDVRAKTITDTMIIAAAQKIAELARRKGLTKTNILPNMLDWEMFPRVAATVGRKAQEEGLARRNESSAALYAKAMKAIEHSRLVMKALTKSKIIKTPPSV
jgi:malate dehydrogenase (oxaloacetate-decarboxylating)